ncbi:MAG: DUF4397 domain-containing protein [Casimicrobiaceae bacterium]
MSLPRISLLAALACVLALAGCKVDTINSFPVKPASVRFIGVVADSATLDVKQDNKSAWTAVPFAAPTAYQQFDNTQTTFDIYAPSVTAPITSVSGSLAANQDYTILAFGTIANPGGLIQSDAYSKVNPGNTQLRFTHLAEGVNGLDIYLSSPGLPLTNVGPQYQLGYSGNTNFALTDTGDYELRLLRSNSGFVAFDSGTISLPDQATQSLYFFAKDATHAINVLKVDATGNAALIPNTIAAVKVVNAAYQTGAVDQKYDGISAATNLAYPGATQTYYTIPAGTHTMTFEATAAPGATIASANVTLVAATDSTLLISGANGSQVITQLYDINLAPPSGVASVRFIDASPDVPAFDVVIDGNLKASNVAYTHASAYFTLDNSNHKVQLMVPGTMTPIYSIDSQQFGTQQVTSFYLTGPSTALKPLITQDNI